jgi:uncharacterized membrane protein
MSKYTSQILIDAPADEVFAYVSDTNRMPEYLPTVHGAMHQGAGRILVKGEAAGHPYESDGRYEVDEDARTMRWGSDGEHHYSGHLEVQDRGNQCFLSVTLDFEPNAGLDEEFKKQMGGRDTAIREGLEASLRSIKNLCEGVGGKVPTEADRNQAYLK